MHQGISPLLPRLPHFDGPLLFQGFLLAFREVDHLALEGQLGLHTVKIGPCCKNNKKQSLIIIKSLLSLMEGDSLALEGQLSLHTAIQGFCCQTQEQLTMNKTVCTQKQLILHNIGKAVLNPQGRKANNTWCSGNASRGSNCPVLTPTQGSFKQPLGASIGMLTVHGLMLHHILCLQVSLQQGNSLTSPRANLVRLQGPLFTVMQISEPPCCSDSYGQSMAQHESMFSQYAYRCRGWLLVAAGLWYILLGAPMQCRQDIAWCRHNRSKAPQHTASSPAAGQTKSPKLPFSVLAQTA